MTQPFSLIHLVRTLLFDPQNANLPHLQLKGSLGEREGMRAWNRSINSLRHVSLIQPTLLHRYNVSKQISTILKRVKRSWDITLSQRNEAKELWTGFCSTFIVHHQFPFLPFFGGNLAFCNITLSQRDLTLLFFDQQILSNDKHKLVSRPILWAIFIPSRFPQTDKCFATDGDTFVWNATYTIPITVHTTQTCNRYYSVPIGLAISSFALRVDPLCSLTRPKLNYIWANFECNKCYCHDSYHVLNLIWIVTTFISPLIAKNTIFLTHKECPPPHSPPPSSSSSIFRAQRDFCKNHYLPFPFLFFKLYTSPDSRVKGRTSRSQLNWVYNIASNLTIVQQAAEYQSCHVERIPG